MGGRHGILAGFDKLAGGEAPSAKTCGQMTTIRQTAIIRWVPINRQAASIRRTKAAGRYGIFAGFKKLAAAAAAVAGAP